MFQRGHSRSVCCTVSWFLTLFCNLTTLSLFWARRSMDGFLLGGWPSIHRIAIAVLAELEDCLLEQEFGNICMTLRKPDGVAASPSLSLRPSPSILHTNGNKVFQLTHRFEISSVRLRRLERDISEARMLQSVERMLIEKNAELEREQERIRSDRSRNFPEAHKSNNICKAHPQDSQDIGD